MPTVKNIERKIGNIEGFDVVMKQEGENVRGDKKLQKQYSKQIAAKGTYTVAKWIKKRFKVDFPGYDVDVLFFDGDKATGNTLLSTVRDSYTEEDDDV